MTRLEANRQIVKKLSEFIEKNPDQRFSQAIVNLGLVNCWKDLDTGNYWLDEYHIEPEVILSRINIYGQD